MTSSDEPRQPINEAIRAALDLDGDPAKVAAFYDRWAASYDQDVVEPGYGLPSSVVATIAAANSLLGEADRFDQTDPTIVDVGCGTGAIGVALHRAGYRSIDGLDLSEEMANRARSHGVYRLVEGGFDLTAPLPERWREVADIVVVGGVFTPGHVGPEALDTAAGVARPGGILVASTRPRYLAETNFEAHQEQLVVAGKLELVTRLADQPYTADSTGDFWAWLVHG